VQAALQKQPARVNVGVGTGTNNVPIGGGAKAGTGVYSAMGFSYAANDPAAVGQQVGGLAAAACCTPGLAAVWAGAGSCVALLVLSAGAQAVPAHLRARVWRCWQGGAPPSYLSSESDSEEDSDEDGGGCSSGQPHGGCAV